MKQRSMAEAAEVEVEIGHSIQHVEEVQQPQVVEPSRPPLRRWGIVKRDSVSVDTPTSGSGTPTGTGK